MPIFRSTQNIFKDFGEVFEDKWFDTEKLVLPHTKEWDYSRELSIEDIDIWEVLYESKNYGVYASWSPFAEFYMITNYLDMIETFYGEKASKKVKNRAKDFGITLYEKQIWVDDEDMWLY